MVMASNSSSIGMASVTKDATESTPTTAGNERMFTGPPFRFFRRDDAPGM
jgi:hypothetical protein